MVKHGLSVLIQQHLVLWYTSQDDHLTLYEANATVAYSLVRSGKYIQFAEAQAGEFAGKVISNLLLLGHARVGDLVQAYRVGQSHSTQDRLAVSCGSPSELKSSSSGDVHGSSKGPSATLESIYGTLCDLLRAELVSRVHVSHFCSDTDNRIDAENAVPKAEEYKAKSRREQNAQREAAVQRKLKEWRFCTDGGDDEVEGPKIGKKRWHQDITSQRLEKRKRLYSSSSQEVIGATGGVKMLGESGNLDVRTIGTSK